MKFFLRQQSAQYITASFLVVWLSGVVFLFCCEMPQAQAASTESCPLAKINHCGKQSSNKNAFDSAVSGNESPTFDCCGFLSAVFDKTRKIENTRHAAQPAAKIIIDAPRFTTAENTVAKAKFFRPIIQSRNKIFIKNCVFRI